MYKVLMIFFLNYSLVSAIQISHKQGKYTINPGEIYIKRVFLYQNGKLEPLFTNADTLEKIFRTHNLTLCQIAQEKLACTECSFIANPVENTLTIYDPDIIGRSSYELINSKNGYLKSVVQLFKERYFNEYIIVENKFLTTP